MLLPLLEQLRVARPAGRPRTRPEAVLGDKAYSSKAIRTHLRARRITAVIPESADQQGQRRRRGSAGGRPVGLDSRAYKGLDVIERQYAHLKQWRGLAARYDKYAIVDRAAVVLHAVLAWSKRLSDMIGCASGGHRVFTYVTQSLCVIGDTSLLCEVVSGESARFPQTRMVS